MKYKVVGRRFSGPFNRLVEWAEFRRLCKGRRGPCKVYDVGGVLVGNYGLSLGSLQGWQMRIKRTWGEYLAIEADPHGMQFYFVVEGER